MDAQKVVTRKRSAKSEERTASLMSAAIDLFSERDYSSVTISDIARHAGVAHSLVYYHFKSKDDLFHKAVTNLIETTLSSYGEIGQRHGNPVELIESWFANNLKLSRALRKLVKIMFDYSGPRAGSPSVEKAIASFYAQELKVISDNVTRGIEQGLFHDVDPNRVAAFVSTHIDGIFYDSFIRRDDDMSAAMDDLKWGLWSVLHYK
jgi:AcrR family transcriptional regulator